MSATPPPRRRLLRQRENPFRGGLTGIALVALATLALAVIGAGITAMALLIAS